MLELIFPTRCVVCDAVGSSPCASCARQLRPAGAFDAPSDLDTCAALLAYEGVARQMVMALKYRNRRHALPRLADAMSGLRLPTVDAVTWAPTSQARRRGRGFDQAELLARAIARRMERPCRRALRRQSSPPQTGRSLAARLDGPVFVPVGSPHARVLLVDDVLTTGATLSAAARALRHAGTSEVHGLVLARTAAPGDSVGIDAHSEGVSHHRPT